MATRYGVGYLGSKNQIAETIINILPPANTLVDLFCGGCAITHCAMLSNKWNNIVINDINHSVVDLFVNSINGEYTTENQTDWISRERFFEEKENNPYIKYVWSFGNNGITYLYGKANEDRKKALHYACFYEDYTLFDKLEMSVTRLCGGTPHERYASLKKQFKPDAVQIEHLNRLKRLEELQELKQTRCGLRCYFSDYQSVPIPDNAIIYCDIPYNTKYCGSYNGFNHERFYDWAKTKDNIFISEYSMPEPFVELSSIQKRVLCCATDNSIVADEKIYTTQATIDKYNLRIFPKTEQLTLW